MKRHRVLTGLAIAALAAGCGNKNPSTPPPEPPREAFEKMKDPPIYAKTHFAAGQLSESQGHLADARQQYLLALQIDPKYTEALFRLGVVQTEEKDFTKALETWEKYVTQTGGSAAAYGNLGFCQEVAGDAAAAEGSYKKGLMKDPNNEACHINYGLMLARQGRPNEGMLHLQKVLSPAEAHYDLGSVYESLGQKREARAEYRKALELDPKMDDAKSRIAALAT